MDGDQSGDARDPNSLAAIFEKPTTLVLELHPTERTPRTGVSRKRVHQVVSRSARADYRACTVAAVFGTAPRLHEAATGITSYADRKKIAARMAEPSAARYRCAFKHG
jgi:hypothetical protein